MASSVTAAAVANAAADAASPTGGNFKSLSYYLAKNEVALYPKWNVYDTLYGSIKWQPNMGSTLTGTTPTPSPVLRMTFMPEVLTAYPKKDQFTVGERTEDASLGMHRFESNRFRFLSNFESFWRDHLSYAQSDIVRQIQTANNVFIRTLMYYQAPDLYISGQGLSSQVTHADVYTRKRELSQADIRKVENGGDSSTDLITDGTSGQTITVSAGNMFRNDIAHGGTAVSQPLTLKEIFKAMLVLQEDVQAPPFERTFGAPNTSEMVKGKYVLICSTEAWASLLWDTNLRTGTGTGAATQLAPANMNLLQDGFAGDLFGKITAKFDPYPLRFSANGDFIAPQTVDTDTGKCVPNPNYTKIDAAENAVGSHEIAFLVGADAFKTISVGPPPKEFASKNMSAKKFYGMKWNGEVNLTDQFLIPTGSGSAPLSDAAGSELNTYGDYLKFISQVIIGGIAGDTRYCLPISFLRRRTS
tara:strand:+ start:176 stop:1591 length:1416 start_codon:yes stop_codon:yes gene_type:complete